MKCFEKIKSHCEKLGIRHIAPYAISVAQCDVVFSAYLPDFGSEHGILIDEIDEPSYEISEMHRLTAEKCKIPVSFVNPNSIETEEDFLEALKDWGFYGEVKSPNFLW